jgi:methylated-DNA-protein-cysteine methyltransferase related protein
MAKSDAFTRIKQDVLSMTLSISAGLVSTYRSLGEHIDVMPRHVAYILATLTDEESAVVPWHRVVAEKGAVSTRNRARAKVQVERLQAEGIPFESAYQIQSFDDVFVPAAELPSGVPAQKRSDH